MFVFQQNHDTIWGNRNMILVQKLEFGSTKIGPRFVEIEARFSA